MRTGIRATRTRSTAKTACVPAPTANAAAGPAQPSTKAPSAGPAIRAVVIGAVLRVIAVCSSLGRTRSGITDCMAGPPMTKPIPTRKEQANTTPTSRCGPGSTSAKNTASAAEPRRQKSRPSRIWRDGSPRSASAPAQGPRASWGTDWATVTRLTAVADPVPSYTTTAAVTPCIHTPADDSSLPQKRVPKVRSRTRAPALRGARSVSGWCGLTPGAPLPPRAPRASAACRPLSAAARRRTASSAGSCSPRSARAARPRSPPPAPRRCRPGR